MFSLSFAGEGDKGGEIDKQVIIAVVYDNHGNNSVARRGSGFSCLVKMESAKGGLQSVSHGASKRGEAPLANPSPSPLQERGSGGEVDKPNVILFDTGAHGPTLLYNLEQMGFPSEAIGAVVLSHIDSDHIGGLFKLLERNWQVKVYVPESFPSAFKDLIALYGARVVEVAEPVQICPQVESSGEMGTWIKEQSLIIRTEKGVILIVGDAHPGIVSTVAEAERIAGDKVYMALGGFHLSGTSLPEMQSVLRSFRELGVKKVAPCHSTGDEALRLFQQEYKEDYIPIGAGSILRE